VLLLGKVEPALVVRDSVRVRQDDLARVRSLPEKGADDTRRRRKWAAGVVVEDREQREGEDGNGSGRLAVEAEQGKKGMSEISGAREHSASPGTQASCLPHTGSRKSDVDRRRGSHLDEDLTGGSKEVLVVESRARPRFEKIELSPLFFLLLRRQCQYEPLPEA
jgi:hypothetical protein